jgi:short-subunit dehydrogenase
MEEQKKTALVTGASSGIGRETAIKLAEKGFQVIAAARRTGRLNELAEQFQNITPMQVDLSQSEDTEVFCDYISTLSMPVSVLINNAGYSIRGALEDVSMEAIKRIFEVNLFALIRITQACLPGMRYLRKGTIVNLSSIAGKFAFPGSGVYAATKYAVEGITDALRMELAPFGIRVVAIRPGPIPGPDLIADCILQAVLSDAPNAVYSAGPLRDDFLEQRASLDDNAFHRFMMEKFDLMGLQT